MNELHVRNVIEAALLAAGRPLQVNDIAQLFDESSRPAASELRVAIHALGAEYEGRGIELKETAAGFRIQVRRDLANEISRLWPERPVRYSRALLETLALIAYRQPITRAEIEAVRGVAVNPNIIKTLLERGWVRVVGQRDVPGRPELLGTTREFLDYFGLKRLEDLPPLAELKSISEVHVQLDFSAVDGQAPTFPPQAETTASDLETEHTPESAGGAAIDTRLDKAERADESDDGGTTVDDPDEAILAQGEKLAARPRRAAAREDAAQDEDSVDQDELDEDDRDSADLVARARSSTD
jgi:segregation and condensation protein B